jgi:hypothetical protein
MSQVGGIGRDGPTGVMHAASPRALACEQHSQLVTFDAWLVRESPRK